MAEIQTHTKKVSKFALVGVGNTVLDFTIYNLLIVVGLMAVAANVVSVTVAMIVSFELNRRFVFSNNSEKRGRQMVMFFVVTGIGLYVLQTLIIATLVNYWAWPLEQVADIAADLGFKNSDFVINNGAKAIATTASMVWNYLLYDKLVFKDEIK